MIESPETIAQRIRDRLQVVPADRLLVAPDCGLGYFSRSTTYGKLRNMGKAVEMVRAELGDRTTVPSPRPPAPAPATV
jgi:5-methyltetrahydropteroyltriglutamate--homocysteine methyltransferase